MAHDPLLKDYMKKYSVGLLETPDTKPLHTPVVKTHPTRMSIKFPVKRAPSFIGGLKYDGPLSNKHNIPLTYDNSKPSVHNLVTKSKNDKDIMGKILFSCYHGILLTLLGNLNMYVSGISPENRFLPLLVGGMALRFYNQSYSTHDMDIKIYPSNIDKAYKPAEFLEIVVKPIIASYLDNMKSYMDIKGTLIYYINNVLKPYYGAYPVIYRIGTSMEQMIKKGITFKITNPYVFDVETKTLTKELNKDILKVICYFNEQPENVYKLMDISIYDPKDIHYNDMISSYYEDNPSLIGASYIPPYQVVTSMSLPYYIESEEFMRYEKNYLLNKHKDNPFFTEKFSRAIEGLNADKKTKEKFIMLGGKKKTRKTYNKKTNYKKQVERKHKKSRKQKRQ